MKNTLFIMTHLGSGWEKLAATLEECPYLQVYKTGNSYRHPEDVKILNSQAHKWVGSASKYADVIFHNKDFSMKRLCNYYEFIFWSCPLEDCIDELITNHKYGKNQAEDYWNFRIEGMRQYYLRSPGSLWNPNLQRETIFSSLF